MTKSEPFISMLNEVYDSQEFQALVPNERAILWELIRKFNGFNNGEISLGVREAARKCRIGQMAACRALTRLQESGLISATYKGHLVPEIGRPNVPTRWRINFKDSTEKDDRKRFRNDTAGCFRNDTSPPTPDRFRNDTSPPVSFQKRSIDNLTKTKSEIAAGRTVTTSSPGYDPGEVRRHQTSRDGHSIPGKPNGIDRAPGLGQIIPMKGNLR